MAEESLSLKPFLLGDRPNKALSKCAAAATAALSAGSLGLGALDWRDLSTEIAQKLEQMFDIRLTDVLAAAWKDYRNLAECADPTKHPADETISLPMVDHRVETSLRPCLDVIIGARPPIRVAFEITCGLELKGLVLKIEDATIRAIRVGSCRAEGSVKCEGITLIERETKELDLRGLVVLPCGIPIRPHRAANMQAGRIRVLGGALAGTEVRVSARVILGRDPAKAQIVFPREDTAVSRRHCEIRFDSAVSLFEVRDLGSRNGTFIANGSGPPRRLAPDVVERLAPGQNILVGSSDNLLALELG